MKIDLFDVAESIELNKMQEITSPILFQRGDIPHPEGLVSNEIFGITTKSRKETYAYIDLHGYFFHPHVYKAIKRMFRNIEKIISGEMYYSLDKNGRLVVDNENGNTGIEWIYEVWDKINWEKSDEEESASMRKEREDLLKNHKKNEIFMHYQIVSPAFYRDIRSGSSGGKTVDVNNLYVRLIRMCSLLKNRNMFDFTFHSNNSNIQNTIVEIYDYYKQKLEKKNGLIRKYLMGKNVDFCTRTVITNPTYKAQRPEDCYSDFSHAAIPISQVCSLCFPFMMQYLKNFFENEVIDKQYAKIFYDPKSDEIVDSIQIKDPESYFSDKYIKKMIDTFIKDPESRFNKIEIPTDGKTKYYLAFSGMRSDTSNTSEISGLVNRPMTWTDLLYLAAVDVTKDKHAIITRYPVSDEFSIFITKIRVTSTTQTKPMVVNNILYKWYPQVEIGLDPRLIGNRFNDACQFSNAYLEGINGDYDGDQTTVKIIFTQEANNECEAIMNRKSNFINSSGNNVRTIGKEAAQTFYALTKDKHPDMKTLTDEEKDHFLHLKPEELTFSMFIDTFGTVTDTSKRGEKNNGISKPKYTVADKLTILPTDKFMSIEKPTETTLGRVIFNKMLIESLGFDKYIPYQNIVMTSGNFKAFESAVTNLLKNDFITVSTMRSYVETRDWIGLQGHSVITTSFTEKVSKIPPKTKALRKKLFAEYSKEIAQGNVRVMEKIEDELIKSALEELGDDPGLDLYISGARGSIKNHLKNMYLTRGAIKNPTTKKYEIITNSLMDGLAKKDIGVHGNMIISGSYPKSCATAVTGYMAKELLAAFQSEVIGPKDSDCGSLRTIPIDLTESNYNNYIYRYIKVGNSTVMLTDENKSKYVGKTVNMRTPLYCIGYGKTKCLCNKCVGDYNFIIEKPNIGLTTTKCGTALTNLNMKKFHENTATTQKIDLDDIII